MNMVKLRNHYTATICLPHVNIVRLLCVFYTQFLANPTVCCSLETFVVFYPSQRGISEKVSLLLAIVNDQEWLG